MSQTVLVAVAFLVTFAVALREIPIRQDLHWKMLHSSVFCAWLVVLAAINIYMFFSRINGNISFFNAGMAVCLLVLVSRKAINFLPPFQLCAHIL